MSKAAVSIGAVDIVLSDYQIAGKIMRLVKLT